MESQHTLLQAPRARDPAAEPAPRRRIAARPDAAHPDAAHPDDASPQELVLGRYRVLEELGSGGFGVVWRAHDELLHRDVALKRVWLGPDGDSERASREALAAARLSHPAIVALHEACAHEGAFYLISELVDGETLAQLIVGEALEDEEVLEIGLALASALVHAHARGVIHRDIKPQNVLVPHPPVDGAHMAPALVAAAKLTDFGGASLAGEDVLTRTGDVLGTLAYMAPEQSEGREAGVQADLYSLALVIYEALCGSNPVRGSTPAATARRIGRSLPPLARARRDLPPGLTRALDRALAPAPQERGTLEELRAALEDTLERGLARPRWRARALHRESRAPDRREHARTARARPDFAAADPLRWQAQLPRPPEHDTAERRARERQPYEGRPHARAARAVWAAGTLALVLWQTLAGRPGVALLALAALAPLLILAGERFAPRAGAGWLACVLAPALGWIGLAGAFPALAGQASRWRERAALGALGFWWLRLAEPLLGRRLWLREPAGTPARSLWEASVTTSATHVIVPLLGLGVLLGALLWAAAAASLPWLVRGRSAVRDVVAASVWTAAIAAAAPTLDGGLGAHAGRVDPRGAVLGATIAALLAVAARALRGPV
ncbi:MAG TPA: serine/threonine-protein kinase [Solirubrobacteraceae bacterium]|nr:serine/threonine-protein kinase [Solirubrobacteraceae bacterium]